MSRWDPDEVVEVTIITGLIGAMTFAFSWLLWTSVIDYRDMSSCRSRGGNIEHLPSSTSDWRCVGATPERAP